MCMIMGPICFCSRLPYMSLILIEDKRMEGYMTLEANTSGDVHVYIRRDLGARVDAGRY